MAREHFKILNGRKAEALKITPAVRRNLHRTPLWVRRALQADGKTSVRLMPVRQKDKGIGQLQLKIGKHRRIIQWNDWLVFHRRRILVMRNDDAAQLKPR